MNHNEIETTTIQTLGVRGRVQQRDDTEISRASPYPDIRFGEELGAEGEMDLHIRFKVL